MNFKTRSYGRILLLPSGNDQKLVGQGPLQLRRIGCFALQPEIDLIRRREDNGHGLRMSGRCTGVGLRGQKAEQLVFAFNRSAL